MAAMNEKDYYAILGVESSATTDEIRRAFQKKARKLHPDVNKAPDAEEKFKEVSEAYAVLSDESKRKRYDAMRSGSPFAGSGFGGSYGGSYGGPAGAGSPFGWGFPFGGAGQAQSGTRSRSYNPRAGADVVYELTLDDEAAKSGTKRGVTYQRYVACEACSGHGSVESEHAETCPTCGGSGHIHVDLSGIFGFGVVEMGCPECEGTGKVVANPCESCGGSGRVLSASEVVVEVPAGSHDGDEIRLEGKGNAGTNASSAGDFVCRVRVPSEQMSPLGRLRHAHARLRRPLRGIRRDRGRPAVAALLRRHPGRARRLLDRSRRRPQGEPALVAPRTRGLRQRPGDGHVLRPRHGVALLVRRIARAHGLRRRQGLAIRLVLARPRPRDRYLFVQEIG